jgi:hypothetical protein
MKIGFWLGLAILLYATPAEAWAIPPAVIAIASLAATAASTGIAVAGAVQQAQAARETAKTQQKVAAYNVAVQQQQAALEKERIEDRRRQVIAAQRAGYGAAGVTAEGSPLDVMIETAKESGYDAALSAYNAQLGAQRASMAGMLAQQEARAQETAAYYQAGGSLLSGIGTGITQYRQYQAGKSPLAT